jgi:hypothetical protein
VPGTELTPQRRADLVRNLTIAGWLLLGGPIGFLLFQLDRVRRIGSQPFASVWDQRIEVLSFLMLPPNQTVLVPVVFVAAVAIWLTDGDHDVWLTTLLRLSAALAITFVVIGVISIVSILARDDAGTFDTDSIFLRFGGIAMAAGLALICRTADRATAP